MFKKIPFSILFFLIAFNEIAISQWIEQNSGVASGILSISFSDANTGFAGTGAGQLLKTTNGGDSWKAFPSGAALNFNYIKFFGRDTCLTANNLNDSLYFTTNGGTTWYLRDINTSYFSYNRCLDFINYNTGFYYSGGYLYKTINNGQNWNQYSVSLSVRNIDFVNENTGWACGRYSIPFPPGVGTHFSEIRRTTNGGQNWTIQISIQELSYSISKVFFLNYYHGYYNDFSSVSIARTQNGGSSYSGLSGFGSYTSYHSLCFPAPVTGYFLGGKLMKSTNAGVTWSQLSTPHSANSYLCIEFINELTGWLGGVNGIILKTTSGGTTSLNQIGTEIPHKYELYQNYPNPFNSSTVIRFSIPAYSEVKLSIADISGKELAHLAKGYMSAGTYEVDFNSGEFCSGVYFCRLESINFKSVKKMLLLK
ncbi:MAG: Ycf48-like protein [Ignavibacteria bacterium]|nr:Ycf48-like protein [Ignavibacteria bacterium]